MPSNVLTLLEHVLLDGGGGGKCGGGGSGGLAGSDDDELPAFVAAPLDGDVEVDSDNDAPLEVAETEASST